MYAQHIIISLSNVKKRILGAVKTCHYVKSQKKHKYFPYGTYFSCLFILFCLLGSIDVSVSAGLGSLLFWCMIVKLCVITLVSVIRGKKTQVLTIFSFSKSSLGLSAAGIQFVLFFFSSSTFFTLRLYSCSG